MREKTFTLRKCTPIVRLWDLPGGTIEFGKDPYETLIREFNEETGLTEIQGVIKTATSFTIIYPFVNEVFK
ncbi:NUDIX domain-containing protein [Paenibacillus sp. DMB20]|uniref:NUDIX domain-containing protein n=1 Tax=Paenibacillus sp. DMB20 TaxID=1642570 RepID=UPI0009E3BDC1|nr:NUDIX domain-containing protein [Paenibacillus sp. DMB20]